MPNRLIKESICTSDTIDALGWFDEVFFYRLTVNVDDYGRFDARPAILRSRLFPLKVGVTDEAVRGALGRLEEAGLVTVYTVGGKPYLFLQTWDKHQRIRNALSKFPAPDDNPLTIDSNSRSIDSDSRTTDSNSRSIAAVIQSNPNPNPNPNPKSRGAAAPARTARGEYSWVKLSDEEYARLLADLGEAELARCIRYVDEAAQGTGNKNKWKDWALTIRRCARDKWGVAGAGTSKRKLAFQAYDQGDPAVSNAQELDYMDRQTAALLAEFRELDG